MAISFPTGLDSLTNPASTDKVTSPDHATQHANANDICEALEAKVGINSSAVTTSHDYKLSGVAGTDKAVSLTGNETLTTKTLTSPKVGTAICDTGGNEIIKTPATASAVNELTITNAAAGNDVLIDATGGSTDIGIKIKPKGAGLIKLGTAEIEFPNADGNINQILKTDGSATLGWVDQATSPSCLTIMPKPNFPLDIDAERTATTANSNTTMHIGQFVLPFEITVNKISFAVETKTTNGTVKIAIYSESGATKEIEVTSGTVDTANTMYTVSLGAPVTLSAGVHYIGFLSIDTANFQVDCYTVADSAAWVKNLVDAVSGEPILEGTVAVTADTIPATITPTTITSVVNQTMIFRLDN